MTEAEFKHLLAKIDRLFLPRQIGSSGDTWVAVGSLLGDGTVTELEEELKNEPFNIDFKDYSGEVHFRVEDKDRVLLTIPKIPRINLVLFLLTILTTLFAGALMEGVNPLTNPLAIIKGLPFSFTLMMILGTHEFGHYYFARKHRVDATLPYFLPAPTFIGTFGAFIKIKSPIYQKRALLQIGAAGPIAGFLVAVPALIIGLMLSEIVAISAGTAGIILGDSLLMKFLTKLIYPNLMENQDIMLHPVAFAGWIGLLVTMLNLLPIGQLDGGHVAYAVLGRRHDLVAKTALFMLIPLSFLSINWLVWGVLIIILMRTTKHPPVYNIDEPLSRDDLRIGYFCLVIFILCFIPVPFQ